MFLCCNVNLLSGPTVSVPLFHLQTFLYKARGSTERARFGVKLAFHDADTDILADIVARMSACRSACHRNYSRKSHVSDVLARILATMSVSVSASWNSSFRKRRAGDERKCCLLFALDCRGGSRKFLNEKYAKCCSHSNASWG